MRPSTASSCTLGSAGATMVHEQIDEPQRQQHAGAAAEQPSSALSVNICRT